MELKLDKFDRCTLCLALDIAIKHFYGDVLKHDSSSVDYRGALCASTVCIKLSDQIKGMCDKECEAFEHNKK